VSEYIENPRRAPRAPIRFDARLAVRDGGFFEAETSDYGPGGCQLPTPVPLPTGARVFVELSHAATPAPCCFSGRVAWTRTDPEPRAGIAFDDGSAPPASRLFDHLARADLVAGDFPRAPDRVPVDERLAPAAPTSPLPVLSPAELVVLAALGPGATAGELRATLAARWDATVNALFALIGRGLVVAGPPDAAAAAEWKRRLLLP
jgi:hypothetical protein